MQRRLFVHIWALLLLLTGASLVQAGTTAQVTSPCSFQSVGDVMTLAGDCTTDSTILIPNGRTLDGRNYTITAVDPEGGHFTGAVVKNSGPLANVVNLRITSAGLADAYCDGGDNALRGIFLAGASGTIHGNTISNLNQGASACPEGNAIEVQNGSTDAVQTVEITSNRVSGFQKTGIVCDGYVSCLVRGNVVGASAVQDDQPVNGIQIGFGAGAVIENNDVAGNSWASLDENDFYVSTAILLYGAAAGTSVRHNNLMEGNADVGIYVIGVGLLVDNNRVYETGADLNEDLVDFGIYSIRGLDPEGREDTTTNTLTNNKVRGYVFPYNSPEFTTQAGGNNKATSSPAAAK